MNGLSLQNRYHAVNDNTAALWAENAGIGKIREENYYDPTRLALATGIRPSVTSGISRLIEQLSQLTKGDRLADTLPACGLHFTFLPLTLPLYHADEPLPAKVDQLMAIWREFAAEKIVITHLRLVALPDQLLLAGIPAPPALALREQFCANVLGSQWKNELLIRHAGRALPAPFWHSTLLRYGAAFLPDYVRAFFFRHQAATFGNVAGELTLVKTNYNWTECYPLKPV